MNRGLLHTRARERATVSFRRSGATGYDPTTGVSTPGADVTASSAGTAIDPTSAQRGSLESSQLENKGWKLTGAVVLDVDAWQLGTFVPIPDDQLTWNGVVYTVRQVGPVAADGVVDHYRIVASR